MFEFSRSTLNGAAVRVTAAPFKVERENSDKKKLANRKSASASFETELSSEIMAKVKAKEKMGRRVRRVVCPV